VETTRVVSAIVNNGAAGTFKKRWTDLSPEFGPGLMREIEIYHAASRAKMEGGFRPSELSGRTSLCLYHSQAKTHSSRVSNGTTPGHPP
jgi:hypothetical protein